jgi:tyrosyl-tRNA synthetase
MKMLACLLFLAGSLCSAHAQEQPVSPLEELKAQGVVDLKQNRLDDMNSPLQTDSSVPVFWGVAATGSSLHLGNLASLNVIRKYQAAGHPIVVYIDTATAGFDPAGSPGTAAKIDLATARTNGQNIASQVKLLLGPNVEIYTSDDLELTVSMRQLLTDTSLIMLEERQKAPEITNRASIADLLYPLDDAYAYGAMAQKITANKIILIAGKDQMDNIRFSQQFLQVQGIRSAVVIHELLMDPVTAEKMGKRGSSPVNINDPSALVSYVDKLPAAQLSPAWNLLGEGPMPSDAEEVRAQLKTQLLAVATKVNQ